MAEDLDRNDYQRDLRDMAADLWPVLVTLLLCTGVLIFAITFRWWL